MKERMFFVISRGVALMTLTASLTVLCGPIAKAAETLRVGKAVSQTFGYLPLDVGMKYGFFQKEGLAIEEINFAGGAKLAQAVASGAVDIALSGGAEMAFVAKGAPQIAVATISASPAFMGISVGQKSAARNVDDLKGKKIGVTSPGSLTFWMVERLNRVKGWTRESDRAVPLVIGGSPTAAIAALKTGEVDATVGAVQVGYLLEEQHEGRLLLRCSDYVKELEVAVTFASMALVHENPGALRRFLTAWYETVHYMRSHKAETVTVAASAIGYSPAIAERSYDELMPTFSLDGKFEMKPLETLFASFLDLKMLDNSVDMSKVYTDQFLPKLWLERE